MAAVSDSEQQTRMESSYRHAFKQLIAINIASSPRYDAPGGTIADAEQGFHLLHRGSDAEEAL